MYMYMHILYMYMYMYMHILYSETPIFLPCLGPPPRIGKVTGFLDMLLI